MRTSMQFDSFYHKLIQLGHIWMICHGTSATSDPGASQNHEIGGNAPSLLNSTNNTAIGREPQIVGNFPQNFSYAMTIPTLETDHINALI
ncbi:hypothetical protein HGQ98_02400 [Achromobacter ruhlandii]|uniref:Uncharacterized protein n=1 Tax=Achromobacter ruhlandii TaxID=72557 RepID=A0A848NC96_9BURK|nr:hypothetical protein [Achromobacter ruhlandii]NMU88737.1 hypothetical protein [Achromobacter ruhlandii]